MHKLVLFASLVPFACGSAVGKPLSPPDEQRAERTETRCKLNAQELHRTGKAFDREVQRCVAQQSPNLAYWEHCRRTGRQQHLKGLELRDDVNACMDREP